LVSARCNESSPPSDVRPRGLSHSSAAGASYCAPGASYCVLRGNRRSNGTCSLGGREFSPPSAALARSVAALLASSVPLRVFIRSKAGPHLVVFFHVPKEAENSRDDTGNVKRTRNPFAFTDALADSCSHKHKACVAKSQKCRSSIPLLHLAFPGPFRLLTSVHDREAYRLLGDGAVT
jgi:hypothetical protein